MKVDLNRETIRTLLQIGVTIHIPFKHAVKEAYEDVTFMQSHGDGYCFMGIPNLIHDVAYDHYDTFDAAWAKFCELLNNPGIWHCRWTQANDLRQMKYREALDNASFAYDANPEEHKVEVEK